MGLNSQVASFNQGVCANLADVPPKIPTYQFVDYAGLVWMIRLGLRHQKIEVG